MLHLFKPVDATFTGSEVLVMFGILEQGHRVRLKDGHSVMTENLVIYFYFGLS